MAGSSDREHYPTRKQTPVTVRCWPTCVPEAGDLAGLWKLGLKMLMALGPRPGE